MAEHQVTNAFEDESDILKTLGCMAFILPHTLVRVVSFALVLAFLKYFATIPAAVGLITSTIIALVAARYDEDKEYHFLYATVLAGICAPFTFNPRSPSHRLYLKFSMLTTNIYHIICLLVIFFLPNIMSPEILIQIDAFQHLNFNISGVYFEEDNSQSELKLHFHSQCLLNRVQVLIKYKLV